MTELTAEEEYKALAKQVDKIKRYPLLLIPLLVAIITASLGLVVFAKNAFIFLPVAAAALLALLYVASIFIYLKSTQTNRPGVLLKLIGYLSMFFGLGIILLGVLIILAGAYEFFDSNSDFTLNHALTILGVLAISVGLIVLGRMLNIYIDRTISLIWYKAKKPD